MLCINLEHFSLRWTQFIDLHKPIPYAHMHVQTHAKYFQNNAQMLRIERLCTSSILPQCVTVVCVVHRACVGPDWWEEHGNVALSSAGSVHPHSAGYLSKEMPVTGSCLACQRHPFPPAGLGRSYRHNPMVHSLCGSHSWHLDHRDEGETQAHADTVLGWVHRSWNWLFLPSYTVQQNLLVLLHRFSVLTLFLL